ncbi:Imm39 family immunity protein [Achromobacter pestifer]
MNARRSLLVGGVSLGERRPKLSGQALLMARNEIEPKLLEHGYLKKAPFQTVSIIIKYADREDLNPEIGGIDSKNQELPVSVMLEIDQIRSLSLMRLAEKFRLTMIEVLCDVAANFDLPFEFLDEMRGSPFKQ